MNKILPLGAALLFAGALVADDLNTYTFTEPSNYSLIRWDGTNNSDKPIEGCGWSGGDSTDEWYPQPKAGADIIFDDRTRKYNTSLTIQTFGKDYGTYYPLSFHSITALQNPTNAGTYTLNARCTQNYRDTVSVGAGGMTFLYPFTFNGMILNLAESQSLLVTNRFNRIDSYTSLRASLTAPATTVWKIAGRHRWLFDSCSQYFVPEDPFKGSIWANSAFRFDGTNQHHRLACKKFTLSSEPLDGVLSWPQLVWNFQGDSATTVIRTPIELDLRRIGTVVDGLNTDLLSIKSTYVQMPWISLVARDASSDTCLRFEAPITGVVSNRCLLLGSTVVGTTTRLDRPGVGRTDGQRMVFAADNSGLTPLGNLEEKVSAIVGGSAYNFTDHGRIIYVSTILQLEHPHALGLNNSPFNIEFRYGGDVNYAEGTWYANNCGTGGMKMRVLVGLLAKNGVDVGSGLYLQTNMRSGGNDLYGHGASILIGSEGPGESAFTGTIGRAGGWGPGSYRGSPELRFQAGKGGTAVFGGKIDCNAAAVVISEGDAVFTNAASCFVATADPNGMRVRSGRLLITDANAVKSSVSGLKQEVVVGDFVPRTVEVRAMNVHRWTKAEVGGTDPKYYSDWENGLTNNLLEFTTMPAIDGVTLQPGDLVVQNLIETSLDSHTTYRHYDKVLKKNVDTTTRDLDVVADWVTNRAPSCAYINGIWEVVDTKHWRRVSWLDQDAEVLNAYGTRIRVTDGAKFAGRTFFLANHEDWTYEVNSDPGTEPGTGIQKVRSDTGFHFGPAYYYNGASNWGYNSWASPWLFFQDEPATNPDASFLLKGALTYDKKVLVTDNLSTGKSELGGATAETASFTGTVTLEKPVVYLTAADGGTTKFKKLSSTVDGGTTLVKVGAGTVDLATTTTAFDGIAGLDAREGVLYVHPDYATNRTLAVSIGAESCGCLRIRGSVDLSGSTLAVTAARKVKPFEPQTILEVESGSLTGTPTITGLGPDWTVETTSTKVIATRHKRGAAVFVR